jgi:ribosomal protein S4
MKQINKYKFLNKVKGNFKLSNRILKFKRPKWNIIKKTFLKKNNFLKVPEVYKQNIILGWEKTKKSFKNKINLGRFLLILNNHNKRKRSKVQIKGFKSKTDKINSIYFKRFFELDFFLYSLYLSNSVEESKKLIESRKIYKNDTCINSNSFLKKGDLVSLNVTNFEFSKVQNKFNISENFCSFYEYDYYTQSFIVLKNFSNVNKKDIYLTSLNFV